MSGIAYFFCCLGLLIAGYAVYGVIAEKVFGVDRSPPTPVMSKADGMDYVPMPTWKLTLIQFLNIAGLGPVFGPIVGALYGPAALLWVVFGCIFAGAVHDFISGMMSLRYGGASYPEIISRNLGEGVRKFMVVFTLILLIMVGAVFTSGPAALLASISPLPLMAWSAIIFIYYICATILPINVLIGRIYPFFAALLIFMAVSLTVALFAEGYPILPHVTMDSFFHSTHPQGLGIWPGLFIVIACGAISGFHATQSPMMARCMTNEAQGRKVFYGSMICEGIVGLVWVTLGLSFYDSAQALFGPGPNAVPAAVIVKNISVSLLGTFGGILAILGVVALPVSTGDTAFRSCRMMLADAFHLDQGPIKNRILLALPVFVIGIALTFVDFGVIWRYFGWINQTIACVCLWACSVYLARRKRFYWITVAPAMFMTVVCTAFICQAKIGLNLPIDVSTWIGVGLAVIFLLLFLWRGHTMPDDEVERNA